MLLCAVCIYCNGQEINLGEKPGNGIIEDGGRGLEEAVSAYLETNLLTISLTSVSSLQVVVVDKQTEMTVYSNTWNTTSGQVIDLSALPANEYELSIYAFGKWWWGEFVLEEE